MINFMFYDVLVIGSGIAGLSTAISAAEEGLSVALAYKGKDPYQTNTSCAQGGIVSRGKNDSPEKLTQDILSAGDHINYKKAVEFAASEGPEAVKEYLIDKAGIDFARDNPHQYNFTKEAAHSVRRILHVQDRTGYHIQKGLYAFLKKFSHVDFFDLHTAIDLITNTHNSTDPQERYREERVIGAYLFDEKNDRVKSIFSSAVVLATGGIGNLFQFTSNPPDATGDGMAMAYRTGARIINSEYIQFHPTILYSRDEKRFLISESLRGEGASLMNKQGRHFMKDYHTEGDLAPRDEVARSIIREMEKQDSNYVLLDTSQIKNINIQQRFPAIYQKCKELAIDIEKEAIPVIPAAHYFCGGIKVDLDGRTSLSGLYAAGENACTGVHGANRLASVSLLEGLVFSVRLGKYLKRQYREVPLKLQQSIPDWVFPGKIEEFDSVLINQDFKNLQSTMWNYVGIIRTRKRLDRALSDINYLMHRIERFYKSAKIERRILELRNAVLSGSIIAKAAIKNPHSKGAHFIEG